MSASAASCERCLGHFAWMSLIEQIRLKNNRNNNAELWMRSSRLRRGKINSTTKEEN